MASISARTFANASLRLAYKNNHRRWVEVEDGRYTYRLYLWHDQIEDTWRFETDRKGGNILPRKVAFAIWLAALSEGMLDEDLPNTES